jgi:hypothetical protein
MARAGAKSGAQFGNVDQIALEARNFRQVQCDERQELVKEKSPADAGLFSRRLDALVH